MKKEFTESDDFAAYYAASKWLDENGFSLGSMQRNDPDLHESRICRHRAGDPDCMCEEDPEPKPRRDPLKDMDRCCKRVEEIIRSIRSDFGPQKGA